METSRSKNRIVVDGEASWMPFAPAQGTIGIDDDDEESLLPFSIVTQWGLC
jgi:hypothetical protein